MFEVLTKKGIHVFIHKDPNVTLQYNASSLDRRQCCRSGMFNPDPDFCLSISVWREKNLGKFTKKYRTFTQKVRDLGSEIRKKNLIRIPKTGSKRDRIRIRNTDRRLKSGSANCQTWASPWVRRVSVPPTYNCCDARHLRSGILSLQLGACSQHLNYIF